MGLGRPRREAFSVWKNPGTGWVRELRPGLAPGGSGALTITLNQAASYDQAELVEDPGTAVESWIPENRLGRVDWLITDHLGSTTLLVSQDGNWRYTGDDDPYGINVRSFGDGDPHRFTGKILDKLQGFIYFGSRYYLPEIGRFVAPDVKRQFNSAFVYAANDPVEYIDPDGNESIGHHYVPRNVFSKRCTSEEALQVFDKNTTGPIPQGKENGYSGFHKGWSGTHRANDKAVAEMMDEFMSNFGITKESWTGSQAEEFLNIVKTTDRAEIATFLKAIHNDINMAELATVLDAEPGLSIAAEGVKSPRVATGAGVFLGLTLIQMVVDGVKADRQAKAVDDFRAKWTQMDKIERTFIVEELNKRHQGELDKATQEDHLLPKGGTYRFVDTPQGPTVKAVVEM